MSAFTDSIRLGAAQLTARRMYVIAMVLVPLLTTAFFLSLMHSGQIGRASCRERVLRLV